MHFKKKEIVLFLEMYPIAKQKCRALDYLLYGDKTNTECIEERQFYKHIVVIVDAWIEEMEWDEKEIVSLRYFDHSSLENIAIQLGYANHSTIIYRLKKAIQNIERREAS